MDEFTASINTNAFVRPAARPGLTNLSSTVLTQFLVLNILDIQNNLPDISAPREGSLFRDRFDNNLRWYMPSYVLAPDPDDLFGFDASRSGADDDGNPFHTGLLILGLKKVIPEDVQTFRAANPNVQVKEIPVAGLTATLFTTSKNSQTGEETHKPYPGTITAANDDGLKLTFRENILGPSVITLYHNLVNGGAEVSISGTYDVWRRKWKKIDSPLKYWKWLAVESIPIVNANLSTQRPRIDESGPVFHRPPVHIPPWELPHPQQSPAPPEEDEYVQGTSNLGFTIVLGRKYAANGYSHKFTISEVSADGTPPTTRPIISIDDLKSFNIRQSEFKELTALGDVSNRYPSISRMYFGVLSKTIVVIPWRYSIVRSINGPSSLCTALLDSASSGISKCKFQFTFLIAPDVSPTEMAQLTRELSNHPEFKSYTIKLPDFLKEGSSPELATAFQSESSYSGSIERHIFQLTIEIRDEGADTPAVANANLLIKQLCLSNPPFLTGTISIKLDDYYPDPVEALVVLNFRETSGADELTFSLDEASQVINLHNRSSFDLILSRYALCTPNTINIFPDNRIIAAGSSVSIPLPADLRDLTVLIDRELVVGGAILKSRIRQFLAFLTQDVQSTQYRLGINASDVEYEDRGISQVDVQITLSDLSDVEIPSFSVAKLHAVEGTIILIPLQHAITDLQANVLFTVHPAGSKLTVEHDFIDTPILILKDADLDSARPS